MLLIIGLSGKARSGKDTFVNNFNNVLNSCNHYWESNIINLGSYAFADSLKELLKEEYNWNGLKDKKGRDLLQKVGQEERAKDKDVWVKKLFSKIEKVILKNKDSYRFPEADAVLIVSDFRFKNELSYFRENYGSLKSNYFGKVKFISIRIERNKNNLTEEQRNEISEVDLDDEIFDCYLDNTSTLENYLFGCETLSISLLKEFFN